MARGDVDPITLEPMIDIMPSFQPSKRPRPLAFKDSNRRIEPTDTDMPDKGSLFQYFGAVLKAVLKAKLTMGHV